MRDLLDGAGDGEIAERRGLAMAAVRGLRTFYTLPQQTEVCNGTACHFVGSAQLAERLRSLRPIRSVRCLGHCFAAPSFCDGDLIFTCPSNEPMAKWLDSVGGGSALPSSSVKIPRVSMADPPVVVRNLVGGRTHRPLDEYQLPDGEAILKAIDETKLRGRGGAAFLGSLPK